MNRKFKTYNSLNIHVLYSPKILGQTGLHKQCRSGSQNAVSDQGLHILPLIHSGFETSLGSKMDLLKFYNMYSKTLNISNSFTVANSNSFLSPWEILPTAQEFNPFHHENVCWVYSLKSSWWGNSNEYTKHNYLIEAQKDIHILFPFVS